MKTEIKNREDGEIEINVTISNAEFLKYWDKGFKAIQDKAEIDGFRKGNAPEEMVISKYGEMAILEEMSNTAINETYLKAIVDNKLDVIDQPHIHIVKLSKADDFVYMAHVPVYPTITLPDYKKIASGVAKPVATEVSKEEADKVLAELAQSKGDGTVIDDAFAQSFGTENFPTLESLKSKVKENLALEKAQIAKEKHRAGILEEILKTIEVKLPAMMVDREVDNMLGQTKYDVGRMGGDWAAYLTHTGKTEDEMRAEYQEIGHKRALSQIVLAEIAKAESIAPNDDEIAVETMRIVASTPNAKEDNVKGYVTHILTNEKTLQMLETQ